MPDTPPPERLSYDRDLRPLAAVFLQEHWPSGEIPVDIEYIVDVKLGINIIPVSGLLRTLNIDGYLMADGTSIVVDEDVSAHPSPHRYRFTLAHELAHLVLHEQLLNAANYSNSREWQEFQSSMPEEDRIYYEYQANSFAGLILVPENPLAEAIQEALGVGADRGLELDLVNNQAHRDYVADYIGREIFRVSSRVILRRGSFDGHWPREDDP